MQKYAVDKFKKDKGFHIVREFFDDASAFAKRPDYEEMKQFLEDNPHIKGVIVYHWDRLIRDPDEFKDVQENFTFKKREIWEVTGLVDLNDPDTEMIMRIRTAVSKHEVQRTRQRTRDALAAKKAAGEPIGRPRKLFTVKKLKKFMEGEKGEEKFIFSKKEVAEKFFGMTVKTFNDRLKENEFGHLVGDIPKQFRKDE